MNDNNIWAKSQELIPVVVENNEITVNSRLLHRALDAQTHHRDWMRRRIREFGFVEGDDFRSILSESTGGRKAVNYLLSLDMAKELAMLENNNVGRMIRRYFIAIEKQYRDWIGIKLPQLKTDRDLFGKRTGYDYVQLLHSIGASTTKGAVRSRIDKNRQEFWKSIDGSWFVSEDFGKTIIAYMIARRWSGETRLRRLEYEQKRLAVKYDLDF